MPRVRLSSMYDLKTGSKFGIIGVHTPTVAQLVTRYEGLLKNYKFLKVKSCSIKIACASTLPADPLQIGVEAGKISPADMMNPILYKAVSNESWNAVLSRIYANDTYTWNGDSVNGLDQAFPNTSVSNAEKIYYSLLSQKEWRKVMPQQGLSVKGLKPLVHEVVSAFGQQFDPTPNTQPSDDSVLAQSSGGASPIRVTGMNTVFRGRTLPMPAIPTVVGSPSGDGYIVSNAPTIPRTYVMAIITPPSQLQEFYYRMIVTWDVVFFGLRPTTDFSLSQLTSDGAYSRYVRWNIIESSKLQSDDDNVASEIGCIDTLNTDPELVMES